MVAPSTRLAACLLIGSFTGSTLGLLFVPDPTSVAAFGLAIVCTTIVSGALYWSEWLRPAT